MSGHATLSPSASARWLRCTASAGAYDGAESSEYADEGTAAHTLAARALESGAPAARWLGDKIDVCNDDGSVRRTFEVTDEMAMYVQVYVDAIRDRLHGTAQLLVEQKVDTGLESAAFGRITGTGDAIVLSPTFGLIELHDLKYGANPKNRVDALTPVVDTADCVGPVILDEQTGQLWELNTQLALYGLGALHDFGMLGTFERVHLAIHQPRLDHMSAVEISVADLLAWGETVAGKLAAIDAGLTEYKPSEKACQWCPVKAKCKALADFTYQTVAVDFANVADLTEYGVASAYERVELVEMWLKAVKEAAAALADRGELPGWTWEIGRAGTRKWKDPKAVEEILRKTYRLRKDEVYEQKLISPAQAEKLLAKAHPQRWEDLQEYIVRGEPSKKLVRVTEAKAPLPAAPVIDDFSSLLGTDGK